MAQKCRIVERASQPIASIRTRAPVTALPATLGRCYIAIMQYLTEIGVNPTGAPFAGYFNMDMEDLDLEIGFPVSEPVAGKGEIAASEIPAGKAVSAIHVGPYDTVAAAYDLIQQFVEEQAVRPTGVVYEFYLNDPQETLPQELQTEIVMLLQD